MAPLKLWDTFSENTSHQNVETFWWPSLIMGSSWWIIPQNKTLHLNKHLFLGSPWVSNFFATPHVFSCFFWVGWLVFVEPRSCGTAQQLCGQLLCWWYGICRALARFNGLVGDGGWGGACFFSEMMFSVSLLFGCYIFICIYMLYSYTCLFFLLGVVFLRKMVHWSKWLICMCACILLHTWSLMFDCIYSSNFYTCSMFLFSTCSGFKSLESLSAKWNLKEKFHRWCHSGRCCFRISNLIH